MDRPSHHEDQNDVVPPSNDGKIVDSVEGIIFKIIHDDEMSYKDAEKAVKALVGEKAVQDWVTYFQKRVDQISKEEVRVAHLRGSETGGGQWTNLGRDKTRG